MTAFDRWKVEDIRTNLEQEPALRKIENTKLNWYGHIMRYNEREMGGNRRSRKTKKT